MIAHKANKLNKKCCKINITNIMNNQKCITVKISFRTNWRISAIIKKSNFVHSRMFAKLRIPVKVKQRKLSSSAIGGDTTRFLVVLSAGVQFLC